MGTRTGQICKVCGTRFSLQQGGRFFFDMLHCDACGRSKDVGHMDLNEIHFGFIKGLDHPYAVARMKTDRHIKDKFRGEPLSRDEYHAAAEATLDMCPCGGRFRYDAPARCPGCRSTREQWVRDPKVSSVHYD